MENYFFIGGLFPKEKEHAIRENTIRNLQSAANNLQWKFVEGIEANVPNRLKLLNSVYIGSFPRKYKRWVVKASEFEHGSEVTDVDTGFVNLPIVKELFRAHSLKKAVKKSLRAVAPDSSTAFIGYAATIPIIETLIYAKKSCPGAVCCLIVPDVPHFMNLSSNATSLLARLKNALVEKRLKMLDCYVLLTKYMAQELGIEDKPKVVIEGISDETADTHSECETNKPGEKEIVYTGTLQYKYGVGDLLGAFQKIDDPEARLTICGEGEVASEVMLAAESDKRIKYLGVLPPGQIQKIQRRAYLLVNPRRNDFEFAKYSFPSKMMEYLSSGRPVLAFPLDGIPAEYSPFYLGIDESGLETCLREALEMDSDYLREIGERARRFVTKEKGRRSQASKLIALIEEVHHGACGYNG